MSDLQLDDQTRNRKTDFSYYTTVYDAAFLLRDAAPKTDPELRDQMLRATQYLLSQARASIPWANTPIILNRRRRRLTSVRFNPDSIYRF